MTDVVAEILRYYGFAEESVRGVAETTPEMHCDGKSVSPGIPDAPEMEWEGMMGRGKNIHRPGPYTPSPSIEVGTDIKILARKLYFALGNKITEVSEGSGAGINPSKVYYYDESAGTFASELADFISSTASDVNVPGHAEAEIGDYLAIGYSAKFSKLNVVVATSKTDTSTLVFEYWDGDEWKTLSVTDGSSGFTAAPGASVITWTAPDDWALKSLNNTMSAYYIRVRCSEFTTAAVQGLITSGSIDTAPDVSTEYIYSTENVLLPSYTGFYGMDISEHIVSGNVIDKLTLTADSDFITLKVDSKGQTPSTDTLKALSALLLNEDYPLAYYEIDYHMRTLGSTTPWGADTIISQDVNKLEYGIENSISDSEGQRIGSRFPGFLPAGARNISFNFDYLYLTNKYLELLWGSAGGPTEESGSTEVEFMAEINAGVYGSARIWLPRAIVTAAPLDASGKDSIVQSVKVDAYMENIEIPTATPTPVRTDCLVTCVLNFPDTTAGFDGEAWADATP